MVQRERCTNVKKNKKKKQKKKAWVGLLMLMIPILLFPVPQILLVTISTKENAFGIQSDTGVTDNQPRHDFRQVSSTSTSVEADGSSPGLRKHAKSESRPARGRARAAM